MRDRIKKDENPMNKYQADVQRLRTVKDDHTNQFGKASGSVFRAEMVYSADLDSVLSMLKRSSAQELSPEQYEFYFACLDRIDILITEKNANLTKPQIIAILETLTYFRPKA